MPKTAQLELAFPIEKDVPMYRAKSEKYPWRSMELGDSFFIPDKTSKHLGSAALAAGKRHGRKFSVRTVDGGVRIWRVT